MDPVTGLNPAEDTTYGLMSECLRQGWPVYHASPQDVFWMQGSLRLRVRPCSLEVPGAALQLGEAAEFAPDEVDVIWIRKDPPFDSHYLWLTLLLEHARGRTRVINDPAGLRNANEKLFAMQVSELMPETAVCASRADIDAFVRAVGGQAVIKPIDGFAGTGVLLLRQDDSNYGSIIDLQTLEGRRSVMLQRFLPAVKRGDKRILLVDGEPLGAIWRIPQGGDVRSNIHVGGKVALAELDADDHAIVKALKPHLQQQGLYFVGLDVIGGKLTEVNVTSPTGMQQLAQLTGENMAAKALAPLSRFAEGESESSTLDGSSAADESAVTDGDGGEGDETSAGP